MKQSYESLTFTCWLCGHLASSKDDIATMRATKCPKCSISSAFIPLMEIKS